MNRYKDPVTGKFTKKPTLEIKRNYVNKKFLFFFKRKTLVYVIQKIQRRKWGLMIDVIKNKDGTIFSTLDYWKAVEKFCEIKKML